MFSNVGMKIDRRQSVMAPLMNKTKVLPASLRKAFMHASSSIDAEMLEVHKLMVKIRILTVQENRRNLIKLLNTEKESGKIHFSYDHEGRLVPSRKTIGDKQIVKG
jgi:hypothetical protein